MFYIFASCHKKLAREYFPLKDLNLIVLFKYVFLLP